MPKRAEGAMCSILVRINPNLGTHSVLKTKCQPFYEYHDQHRTDHLLKSAIFIRNHFKKHYYHRLILLKSCSLFHSAIGKFSNKG